MNSAVIAGVTAHGDDFVISVEKDPDADPDAEDAEATVAPSDRADG